MWEEIDMVEKIKSIEWVWWTRLVQVLIDIIQRGRVTCSQVCTVCGRRMESGVIWIEDEVIGVLVEVLRKMRRLLEVGVV